MKTERRKHGHSLLGNSSLRLLLVRHPETGGLRMLEARKDSRKRTKWTAKEKLQVVLEDLALVIKFRQSQYYQRLNQLIGHAE